MSNTVISFFLPSLRGGGAERVIVQIANEFIKEGFQVHLVLVSSEGKYFSEVNEAISIFNLSSKSVLFSIRKLVKYLKNVQPDVIFSVMHHSNVITIISKYLAGVKTKVVISERNTLSDEKLMQLKVKDKFVLYLAKILYQYADSVTTVSHGAAKALSRVLNIPIKKIKVIYNPVDLQEIERNLTIDLNEMDPWLLNTSKPFILGVGRLTKQKDFETLIRAFALVRKKHDINLVILGEGQMRERLQMLARELSVEDSLYMPGFEKNPFIWMKRASLFVLSSRWEGMPNVILQAMACNTPIVSTNCQSGPAEILKDGKYGALVPVGNYAELARAIEVSLLNRQKQNFTRRVADFDVSTAYDGYKAAMDLL